MVLGSSPVALNTLFRPEARNFIKKETLAHVFSCEFCEISKNTFLKEHLRTLLLLVVLGSKQGGRLKFGN